MALSAASSPISEGFGRSSKYVLCSKANSLSIFLFSAAIADEEI